MLALKQPAAGAIVSTEAAVLRWSPHPSGNYRLQMRISHPEGPTLQIFDLNLSQATWRLPTSITLPVQKASVQAIVTSGCAATSINDLLATGPAFVIEQKGWCQIDPASLQLNAGSTLRWAAVQGAQAYRAQIVETPALTLPVAQDSQAWLPPKKQTLALYSGPDTQWPVPEVPKVAPESQSKRALVVQAQCAQHWGSPVAVAMPGE